MDLPQKSGHVVKPLFSCHTIPALSEQEFCNHWQNDTFCLSSPPDSPEGEADGGQVERQKHPVYPVILSKHFSSNLRRYQALALKKYSRALDALYLRHTRRLQYSGMILWTSDLI
jgi:hypothetical protein